MLTKQLNCKDLPYSIQSLSFALSGKNVEIHLSIGSYRIDRTILIGTVLDWEDLNCDVRIDNLYSADIPVLAIPYIHRSVISGLHTLQQTRGNGRLGAYALILERGIERKYIAVGLSDINALKKKVQRLPAKYILETWFPMDHLGRVISFNQEDPSLGSHNRKITKLAWQDNSKIPRSKLS